jgi:hypothetical protein
LPPSNASSASTASGLLAHAQRAPHHRLGIRELTTAASITHRVEALRHALSSHDERASLALALSLASERALPATELALLLPDVEDPRFTAFFLGGASGDRVAMIGALFDDEVLTEDAEAMLLWLATERLQLTSPLDASWKVRARRMARRVPEAPDTVAFLGAAIRRFTEPAVKLLAEPLLADATTAELVRVQKAQAAEVLAIFDGTIDDVLDDEEAPRLLATVTVKSAGPKVGRNDLCPCGSGKKYKKCHEGKDEGTRAPNAAIDPASLSSKDLPFLRVAELAALDVRRLKKDTLLAAFDRASTFRRWVLAERCADALSELHEDGDAHLDLALRAVDAGRSDVVDRLMTRWGDDDLPPELSVYRAIQRAAPALEPLSALSTQLMADPKAPLFELALGLLLRAPGIGIPVARGLVPELPADDGDALVQEIERARDVLDLPPGDPALDLVAALDTDDARRARFELASKELTEERDALRASLARTNETLSARGAEVISLAMRLEEAEDEVAKKSLERPSEIASPPRTPDAERKKLSARIDELKALVQEGNRERAELRRQITDLSEELASRSEQPSTTTETSDELDAEGEPSSPRVPIVPVFSRAARESLSSFPIRIRKQAIELSATLASGEPSAWRNVKQMEGVAKVWSARLGIHVRLLFRVHDDHLEVLDVVTREDLLKVLERWR